MITRVLVLGSIFFLTACISNEPLSHKQTEGGVVKPNIIKKTSELDKSSQNNFSIAEVKWAKPKHPKFLRVTSNIIYRNNPSFSNKSLLGA